MYTSFFSSFINSIHASALSVQTPASDMVQYQNNLIDVHDRISGRKLTITNTSTGVKLITMPQTHQQTLYPIFGSAQQRATDPELQTQATNYIQNIVDSNPNDLYIWSDGSVRKKYVNKAGAAFVVSTAQIIHSQQITLRTNDIAIAELTGLLHSFVWITNNLPQYKTIHLMYDNQYVVKSILKKCKHHLRHHTLFQMIDRFIRLLQPHYCITFHWIPSHTRNTFHNLADDLARNSITTFIPAIDPFHSAQYTASIETFTGAFAPGLGT